MHDWILQAQRVEWCQVEDRHANQQVLTHAPGEIGRTIAKMIRSVPAAGLADRQQLHGNVTCLRAVASS